MGIENKLTGLYSARGPSKRCCRCTNFWLRRGGMVQVDWRPVPSLEKTMGESQGWAGRRQDAAAAQPAGCHRRKVVEVAVRASPRPRGLWRRSLLWASSRHGIVRVLVVVVTSRLSLGPDIVVASVSESGQCSAHSSASASSKAGHQSSVSGEKKKKERLQRQPSGRFSGWPALSHGE